MRLLAKELEGEDTNDEQGSDVEKIEKEITQKTEILEELDYGLSDEYSRSEIETSDEVLINHPRNIDLFQPLLIKQFLLNSHMTLMS